MISGAGGEQQQDTKRRLPAPAPTTSEQERRQKQHRGKMLRLSVQQGDDVTAGVVPPVTVVLDGRSICHRVHLSKHTGYRSLAAALRRMFVDADDDVGAADEAAAGRSSGGGGGGNADRGGLDLSNAVPGHVVAYEDIENDLLLAGDLNWKDFVRVARRIRIIPAKPSSRRRPQS
uniref:Auxin-responsive protein n=1 Tax=Oryza meridionalis TaxID=40149 RepID=A0A0E0DJB0_9ORYZ